MSKQKLDLGTVRELAPLIHSAIVDVVKEYADDEKNKGRKVTIAEMNAALLFAMNENRKEDTSVPIQDNTVIGGVAYYNKIAVALIVGQTLEEERAKQAHEKGAKKIILPN